MRKFTFNHASLLLFFIHSITIFVELLILSLPNIEAQKIILMIWMAIYFGLIQDAFSRTYNPITINYLLSLGVKRKELLKGFYASYIYIFIIQMVITLFLSLTFLDQTYILNKLILMMGFIVASLWGLGWMHNLKILPVLLVLILANINIEIMFVVACISIPFLVRLLQRRFMEESLI